MKKTEKKKNEILASKPDIKPSPAPENRTAITLERDIKLPHSFNFRSHPKIPQILTVKTIEILETDIIQLQERLSKIYPISILFIIACTLVITLVSVGSAGAVQIFYNGEAKIPYTVLAFLVHWFFYGCCFCYYVGSILEAGEKRQNEIKQVQESWGRLS